MALQIQWRRGTAAAWTSANPVLAQGEFGLETDTGRVKAGDGSTAWVSLAYSFESGGGSGVAIEHDNVSVDATVAIVDFGHGFDAVSEDASEVDVTVDETELDFSGSHMEVGKSFKLEGSLTDSIAAATDNFAPTGLADVAIIRLTATGADRNLTGLTGGADGRVILLMNTGSFNVVLVHDLTSTAANRFLTPAGVNFTLGASSSVLLVYDGSALRWRVITQFTLSSTTATAVGTAAAGTSTQGSRVDHVHNTGAGTPSTQAFGDAAATGSGPAASMTDHKHAMPADPVTAHAAAGDPHTGYRLESADHTHATTGLQAGTVDHGALTGLADDDHPQYATNTEFDDHSARHENGGADEITLAGLDGSPVELTNHLNDTVDAHDASAISFTPNGSIAATDVQTAIQEVRDEAGVGASTTKAFAFFIG